MFFRRKLLLVAAVLSGLIICLVGPAAAVNTWNAAADFSATDNPSGVWSYGYESSGAGPLTLFTVETNGPYGPAWAPPYTVLGVPAIWKNTSDSLEYAVAPGEVSLNPGYNDATALCVARWTSPVAGIVNISGYFGAGDLYPMYYYIYKNGSNIFSFTSLSNLDGPFSLTESVSVGTTIDFAVGPSPYPFQYDYGNTPSMPQLIRYHSPPPYFSWAPVWRG